MFAIDYFAICANPVQMQIEEALRRWIVASLDDLGHGSRKRLAQHMGIGSDAITRMLNDDPTKEDRTIKAVDLIKIMQFLGKAPPGVDLALSRSFENHLSLIRFGYSIEPRELGLSEAEWHCLEAGEQMEPATVLALHDLTKLPLSFIRTGLTDELSDEAAKRLLSAALHAPTERKRGPSSKRAQNRAGLQAKSR